MDLERSGTQQQNEKKGMVQRYVEEIGEKWRIKRLNGGEKVREEKDVQ